eukprot:252105-Rhodomonas_salina.2
MRERSDRILEGDEARRNLLIGKAAARDAFAVLIVVQLVLCELLEERGRLSLLLQQSLQALQTSRGSSAEKIVGPGKRVAFCPPASAFPGTCDNSTQLELQNDASSQLGQDHSRELGSRQKENEERKEGSKEGRRRRRERGVVTLKILDPESSIR